MNLFFKDMTWDMVCRCYATTKANEAEQTFTDKDYKWTDEYEKALKKSDEELLKCVV